MAFKAGNKANPLGAGASASKLTRQLKDILAKDVNKAVQVIRDCLDDPEYKTWAATQVLDRVYGKAPQSVELSGPDGGPIQFVPQVNVNKK